MPRLPRLAVVSLSAALALTLSACGEDVADDPTLAAPTGVAESDQPAPTAPCPVEAEVIDAPAGVSSDLSERPEVPANSGPVPEVVQIAEIVEGDGPVASPGTTAAVKYVGAVDKNGTEFDASWNGGPDQTIPFEVCGQDVVVGFSVAPVGMKVGGRRLVRIPDAFGYPGGNPGAGIAAGDAITFVIDLVSVQ